MAGKSGDCFDFWCANAAALILKSTLMSECLFSKMLTATRVIKAYLLLIAWRFLFGLPVAVRVFVFVKATCFFEIARIVYLGLTLLDIDGCPMVSALHKIFHYCSLLIGLPPISWKIK